MSPRSAGRVGVYGDRVLPVATQQAGLVCGAAYDFHGRVAGLGFGLAALQSREWMVAASRQIPLGGDHWIDHISAAGVDGGGGANHVAQSQGCR